MCADVVNPNSMEGFVLEHTNEMVAQMYSMKVSSDTLRGCKENAQTRDKGTGYVFQINSEHTYYNRWKRYCAYNGIPVMSLYELRHTFVSVVKTLPAGEVKQLVGHSQDMDTFGVYGHALTGDDETTAQAVNGVFLRVLKTAQ